MTLFIRQRQGLDVRHVVNIRNAKSILSGAVCLWAVAMPMDKAYADSEAEFHQRLYLGGGVGASYLNPNAEEIPFDVEKRTDLSGQVFLGYDLGSRLSVEAAFNDSGRAELSDDHYVKYRQRSLSVLIYGLNRKARREQRRGLAGFARIGASQMLNSSDVFYVRENDTSVLLGLGAEYGFDNGLAVRGDLTSFDIDSNHAGVSLLYRFGHSEHKPVAAVAPIDEPIVAEPIEPVSVERPPITRIVEEYVLRFDTNQYRFDAISNSILAEIKAYLIDNPETRLELVGYADTRGADDYNQSLSEKRANAVKDYLVSQGVSLSRISSRGDGATDQFGSMLTAKGRRENRRVRASVLRDE